MRHGRKKLTLIFLQNLERNLVTILRCMQSNLVMSTTSKSPPVDGQPSSKQWEQIKEKLKSAWHRKDPASFDKVRCFGTVVWGC